MCSSKYRSIYAAPLLQDDFGEAEPPQLLSEQEGDIFFLTVYYLWVRFHLHEAYQAALYPFDEELVKKLPTDRVEFALQHIDRLSNREDLVKVLNSKEIKRLFSYVESMFNNQLQCDNIRQRPSYYDLPNLRKFCISTAVDMLTFAQFGGWVRLPSHLRIGWFEKMSVWEMDDKCKVIEFVLAQRAVDLAALQRLLPDFT